MADSIAGSLDGASEAELTAAPPPGRRAWAALAVVLMVRSVFCRIC